MSSLVRAEHRREMLSSGSELIAIDYAEVILLYVPRHLG